MNQSAKVVVVIAAVIVFAVAALWYGKQQLWRAQPVGAAPIAQKEKSPIDLRPAAIAKLQELVLKGSDSLYKLRIDSLLTEVGSGTIILKGVAVWPDSSAMHRLHSQQRLPDDIYRFRISSLRFTGIGLSDIIQRRDLDLRAIESISPAIEVYHKPQPYNAGKRKAAGGRTLFGRLKGQLDMLAIDTISIRHGNLIDYSDGRKSVYKDVSLMLQDVLIDSAAERDPSRFLFAKKMLLEAGDIKAPVGNSHYELGIGSVSIYGERREVSIRNLSLKPQGGRQAFLKTQKERTVVFDIDVPAIHLREIDWWALVHGESLLADYAEVEGGRVEVFLDEHLPAEAGIERANFPQQKLMAMKSPVSLKHVQLKGVSFVYEEFTMKSGKQSTIPFNNINATLEGASNIPLEVAARPLARFRGSTRFAGAAPMTVDLQFELPKGRKGAFKGDLTMGAITPDRVNPFSEGMGMVRFTSGQHQSSMAHIEGNNDNVHGQVSIRYSDLHLEPLKSKTDDEGRLKGKKVMKKLANVLFVKDNNPSKGEFRQPQFSLDRSMESNFFGFVWKGLKQGLLKTIGVPLTFANAK
jgi:hypothetical protein